MSNTGGSATSHRVVVGFTVIVQTSKQYEHLKATQLIGSVKTLTFILDIPGLYRVSVFQIHESTYRDDFHDQYSEYVIHSEIISISMEDKDNANNKGILLKGFIVLAYATSKIPCSFFMCIVFTIHYVGIAVTNLCQKNECHSLIYNYFG